MKGNKHAPPMEKVKEGQKQGGEERRQSQGSKRAKKRGEIIQKKEGYPGEFIIHRFYVWNLPFIKMHVLKDMSLHFLSYTMLNPW